MSGISRLAGADAVLCEDWLTKWVVWDAGIHCVVCPGAGFVRIDSETGWLWVGSEMVSFGLACGCRVAEKSHAGPV